MSILKYIFKPKKGGPADIWQPSELDDEDGANEKEEGAMSSALAAEILPPILALIPYDAISTSVLLCLRLSAPKIHLPTRPASGWALAWQGSPSDL